MRKLLLKFGHAKWLVLGAFLFLAACAPKSPLLYCDNVPELPDDEKTPAQYYVCNDYNNKVCVYRQTFFQIDECGDGVTCYFSLMDSYDQDGKLVKSAEKDYILNEDDCVITTKDYFESKVEKAAE